MDSILLSCNVMLPLFLLILLGAFLRRVGLLPRSLGRGLNRLCFQCFLPVMLFQNVRATDFRQAFDWPLIAYAAGTVLLLFAALLWLVPKFVDVPERQSVVIQGIYRSNYVILGIPIVSNIYRGEDITTITMLVALIVPLFNVLAVYLFEHFKEDRRHNARKMLRALVHNPLILATLLGMLCTVSGLTFPAFLDATLEDLAGVTIPLALLILGADLDLNPAETHVRYLVCAVVGKLFLVPLLFLPPAILLGFRGTALASLLAMYASPAAVSGYIMAQNEGADHTLAGQIVAVTSVLSCFTLFVLIALLRQLRLI